MSVQTYEELNTEDSGLDICLECDLIRRTGGLYEWKDSELVREGERK